MEGSTPVLIDAVDIRSVREQSLNHLDLASALIEDSIVEGCATCVVRHMHQVTAITAEDRKYLHRAGLAG